MPRLHPVVPTLPLVLTPPPPPPPALSPRRPTHNCDAIVCSPLQEVCRLFHPTAVSDEETLATMRRYWEQEAYALCPHSAIAVKAADDLLDAGALPVETCVGGRGGREQW